MAMQAPWENSSWNPSEVLNTALPQEPMAPRHTHITRALGIKNHTPQATNNFCLGSCILRLPFSELYTSYYQPETQTSNPKP